MLSRSFFFFFNDTATTEIYTLSLHDALPISVVPRRDLFVHAQIAFRIGNGGANQRHVNRRSEEHTSELQSHLNLVCRLLLEKKKKYHFRYIHQTALSSVSIDYIQMSDNLCVL